jgi:phage terminase small subunit
MTDPTRHRGTPLTDETDLSLRERAFIDQYLTDFNARRAAEAVGYVNAQLNVTAWKVLARPHVQAEIRRRMAIAATRADISAARVLKDIDSAANLRFGELLDANGNLLPVHLMPDHVQRAIVSIEIVKRNVFSGDGQTDRVYKVRLIDKGKMQELLAKATGLVKDGVDGATERPTVPAFALPADTPGVQVH